MSKDPISGFLVAPDASLREAAVCINDNRRGVALVVGEDRTLEMTVTDGDIRRAMLDGVHLDEPVTILRERNEHGAEPITAPVGTPIETALSVMHSESIRQLPLVDDHGRVHDLVTLDEVTPAAEAAQMEAVIMAGGLGTRLRPLTDQTPKPMLRVGDRPLIEHIVHQLRDAGIHRVNISTHYRPESFREHFGDGSAFGVEVDYVNEQQPLGTAGAVGLMSRPREPLLIINGDVLTRVDLRALRSFHDEHRAALTVGVRQYDVQVPYGILDCDGVKVEAIHEKPVQTVLINAGIYLLAPSAHDFIPQGEPYNMTDLIQKLIAAGCRVVSFPIVEYWLDIGGHADYQKAQSDFVGENAPSLRRQRRQRG